MTYQYRVLEDVALADAAFEASGDSPSELFLASAQAVIDTMVDSSTVNPSWRQEIERESPDLPSLLFDWLSEIVYLKDAAGVVFHGVTVDVLPCLNKGWRLKGILTGGMIDPSRQELRSDVKAVTKHLYEVRQEGGRWLARVVLDI